MRVGQIASAGTHIAQVEVERFPGAGGNSKKEPPACAEFKKQVGNKLLRVTVTPRWEGQPATDIDPNFGPVLFGEVHKDVLENHKVDLLPLALNNQPLPQKWLDQQQKGYNNFVAREGAWSGIAHNSSNRPVAVTPNDMRAIYGEVLQAMSVVKKKLKAPPGCDW